MHIAKTSVVLRAPLGAPGAANGRGWRSKQMLALAAASSATFSLWAAQQHRLPSLGPLERRSPARRKPAISWLAVDALSGAIGEIASLVILYPLDSLKVLCQARGASAATVLSELRALGCSTRAVRQLYAGCGSAALCSAAIGSIYLLAFYSAKRLGAAAMATAAAAAPQPGQQQQQGQASSRSTAAAAAAAAAAGGSTGSQLADGSAAHPPLNSEGTHPLVASLAGVAASLAGSVFEAPMEMFKLRTQAGALDGPMLGSMLREASTRGLGSLYATYGAFMLKSIPYDVAELATYSQMCDWRAAAQQSAGGEVAPGWRHQLGGALAALPASTGDMLIGAAAGVASVLVSMPCDVIKTRMDLCPPTCSPGGGAALCSARAFLATGRQLVAAGGPQALFVGVAPRLLQNVPSCMVYWAAVEGTRRLMQQHFEVAGSPEEGGAVAAANGGSSTSTSTSTSSSSSSSSSGSGSEAPASLQPALA